MSRRYELSSTVTINASQTDLTVLCAILEDEEKRIGSRASFSIASRTDEEIVLALHASDATALKTVMSALSAIIRTAEKMNTIGE